MDTHEAHLALGHEWAFWARTDQLPPAGYWFVWNVRAGRGWGKTRTGAQTIQDWAETGVEHMALVGETPADARDVMVIGPSGVVSIAPPWFQPRYYPTKRLVRWPRRRDDWLTTTRPEAHIYSGNKPDQLRGPEHEKAWVDELAKFPYYEGTWSNLLFSMRSAQHPQIVNTTTPRPLELFKRIEARPSTVTTIGSTYDNRENITEVFYNEVIEPLEGTELAAQEIHAELLDERVGAFWKRSTIERDRYPPPPDLYVQTPDGPIVRDWPALFAWLAQAHGCKLQRLGVAIDPAGKSKLSSSETGIIAGGVDTRGHGVVLSDRSGRYSPAGWARAAVSIGEELDVDVWIYESNMGGDMVAHTLRGERKSLPLREVSASRSKQARAEPVSLKGDKGLIHHVGRFPELEDQLCTWVPEPGAESPDRLDAYVWLLTHFMIGPQRSRTTRLPRIMRGGGS